MQIGKCLIFWNIVNCIPKSDKILNEKFKEGGGGITSYYVRMRAGYYKTYVCVSGGEGGVICYKKLLTY